MDKNKDRIQKVIEELGYIPNNLARNLAKGESKQIALFLAVEYPTSSSTWLYNLPIIQSVNNVLNNSGYSLQVTVNSINEEKKNLDYISKMVNNRSIDGLLYFSAWKIPDSILEFLEKKNFPYILVANNHPYKNQNDVLIDNEDAVKIIIKYLFDRGHRTFGIIVGFSEQIHMKERLNTFRRELANRNIEINEGHFKTCNFDIEGGYDTMCEILATGLPPGAIICGNDDIAAGVIKALKEKSIKVPRDVSVTGFDNSVICKVSEPTITTVNIPSDEIGRESTESLLFRIKNNTSIQTKKIRCQIVEGNSVR
jgi:DNA-binding LacI/PurR family transcriptional regulator